MFKIKYTALNIGKTAGIYLPLDFKAGLHNIWLAGRLRLIQDFVWPVSKILF
jgi:hypothetical protein